MRSNSIVFSHFEAQLHVAPVRLSQPMLHAVGVGTEAHWVRRNSRRNVLASEAAATDNASRCRWLGRDDTECSSAAPRNTTSVPDRMRKTAEFANAFKLIWPVQSLAEKYSSFALSENMIVCRHPAS